MPYHASVESGILGPEAHSLGQLIPFKRAKLADTRPSDQRQSLSPAVVLGTMRVADFLVVSLLGFAIAEFYVADVVVHKSAVYVVTAALASALTVVGYELLGLYTLPALSAYVRNMPRVFAGWAITFASLAAGVVFLKIGEDVSRVWLAAWFAAGAAALVSQRLAAGWYVRAASRSGRLYQRAAIYGAGSVTEGLIAELEADRDPIVRIGGFFDDRKDARSPRQIAGYPLLGGLDDLIRTSRSLRYDVVFVSLPLTAEARLTDVVKRLSVLPADVKMPAKATAVRFSPGTYSHVGSVAMIDLFDKPIADWNHVSKWLFDKMIGGLALAALAPVMLLIALAVKLESRGPVFFRQKRYGFNNELIEVLKFRSMYVDKCDASAANLVTKNDPRVTRVGRVIRKTSLDELPQLINVLTGGLSLVGPRPHALQAKAAGHLYDHVVEGYFARHKVKPGITGWAQVNGWRGETDTEEKIQKRTEHDLYYIENWSLFLDFYILCKTPIALLKAENAY